MAITILVNQGDTLTNIATDVTTINTKLDAVAVDAIKIAEALSNPSLCYPTLTNGITIIGGSGAWQLGSFTEIVPTNAITKDYSLHYVVVESASAVNTYELILYKGLLSAELEISRIRIDRESAQSGASNVPIHIPILPANTRISAKVASNSGGSDTIVISVYYNTYD